MIARLATTAGAAFVAMVAFGSSGDAHKPITSKYTFNDDVFPIVRERCGACHVSGGVAPMSLMTHADAVPWGESMRAELIAGHMPPWSVDNAPTRFKNATRLSARELNVLLTWASGGTPIGNGEKTPPPVELTRAWTLGTPDLELPLASFTLNADQQEHTQEFIVPLKVGATHWVRAVDLQPGTPTMVRSATIGLKVPEAKPASGIVPEHVLGVWVPGDTPIPLEGTLGFKIPADAELVVRIRYKKTWQFERETLTDRSAVGVYFSQTGGTELAAVSLVPNQPVATSGEATSLTFSHVVGEDVQAVAIYPDAALTNAAVRVEAVRPDGSREELIAFHPQRDWARRFWFQEPIALPKGTKIEVSALLNDRAALLPPGGTPAPPQDPSTVRLTLNVVRAR